jgi:homoserine dehydrogenase
MQAANDKPTNGSAQKKLTIGLFGFGVVGGGLYKVLHRTPSLNATVKKICIKDASKKRDAPDELFTTSKDEILQDESINVIVEVINESTAGYEIVTTALKNGKAVVSASKKMIAEHLPALLQLQRETGVPFLYEASACASIPVIRNLEEYYDNDLLHSLRAIVNGSTNYILTKMFEDKLDFKTALLQAQQLGFAEADPTLDVDGWDAVHKWVVLLCHAYGIVSNASDILFTGIQNIQAGDAAYGLEKNYEIRLVAQAKKLQNGKVAAFVLPQFVKQDDHLAFVKNEYNGAVIESSFSDKQFFYGKGAGSFPTASAVLSDIAALRYDYKYEYKKLYHQQVNELTNDFYVRVFISFSDWKYIPREKFEWIEEWHAGEDRKYLIAVLPFAELQQYSWWRENSTSLVLTPDAVIEEVEVRGLKKRSLELAGLV